MLRDLIKRVIVVLSPQRRKRFLAMNKALAGRSARRRMK